MPSSRPEPPPRRSTSGRTALPDRGPATDGRKRASGAKTAQAAEQYVLYSGGRSLVLPRTVRPLYSGIGPLPAVPGQVEPLPRSVPVILPALLNAFKFSSGGWRRAPATLPGDGGSGRPAEVPGCRVR